jgi:hypothetical protein
LAESLLQAVLVLLDQIESPVILHSEAASYGERGLVELLSQGVLRKTVDATEIPRPARFGPGSDVIVRQTSLGRFGVADDGDFVAPFSLAEDDACQYEVSLPNLVEKLRKENGITGKGFEIDSGLIPVGTKLLGRTQSAWVYLSLPNSDEEAVLARSARLSVADAMHKAVVLVPGGPTFSTEARRILDESGIPLLSLMEPAATGGNLALDWTLAFQAPAYPHADERAYVLRKSGQVWTLVFESKSTTLKDSKGLAYIAHLLRNPGSPCLAADLFAAAAGAKGAIAAGSAGDVLDSTAIATYKSRAEDLKDQLVEAESNNDEGRKEAIREELEKLADQVIAAKGLGGRFRKSHDDRENFRKAVSMAIGRSITTIRKHLPVLADHLDRNIDRGHFVSYSGDIPWEF